MELFDEMKCSSSFLHPVEGLPVKKLHPATKSKNNSNNVYNFLMIKLFQLFELSLQ